MRVGIVCYPTFGGSGVIAAEIGHSLAARGHEVHFVTSERPARVDLSQPRVSFHKVETKDYPLLDQSPYTLALASKLVEVTRAQRLDLVHVHYAIPHAASAYLARQILGREAPRLVTTLHGTDITVVGNDPSFWPITRFSMLASDLLTVPSRYLCDATRANFDLPAAPIEVIPNFVDTDRFRPGEAVPGRLVHNSNFRSLKRVDDVVRIFARVAAARPDAHLVLVGDGPERPAIEALVRDLDLVDRVRFVGALHDVAPVLRDAALFLMPSASESFGLAALEAQSCGVPVIATNVGGVPEVIADGETGLLSPLADVDKMAADALALLTDELRRSRMGAAARDRAVRLFPREPIVDRYEAAYRSLA